MAGKVDYLDLKAIILQKIKENGGWVNAHAHIDRAYSINKDNLKFINASLQEKWNLNDDLKRNSTVDDIYDRMAQSAERMIEQGVTALGTFIDVDFLIQDKAIKAAEKIREKYKDDLVIKFINQAHYGVLEKEARKWFDIGSEFVDIIGGLPEKDKGSEAEHIDVLLNTAKSMGKTVHVHIDQFNDPQQRDTELLVDKTIEHGMQGKVVGVHGISIGAQESVYRKNLYKKMLSAELMMVCSPIAWIDSKRNETHMPFHNSLTPVDEMVPEGIIVALGTDNIADIYKPYAAGDMWEDLHLLLEAGRFNEIDELVKIATVNGRKVLGLA